MRELIKKLMPSRVKNIYRIFRKVIITLLFKIMYIFSIKNNRVVLCNVWGYGDNPKWIAKALLSYQGTEIIFITDTSKAENVPKEIKVQKTNSLRAIHSLATAAVWVDCNRKEPYIKKRKGQYYIQTWHGSLPLKQIERDYEDGLTQEYIANAKRDSAMADLFISNSDFSERLFRDTFWYNGEIMRLGTAREDVLISPLMEHKEELYRKLLVSFDTKLAVYAPTCREPGSTRNADRHLDYKLLINALESRYGGKFCVIVRMHPLTAVAAGSIEYNSSVINGNCYGDLYELLEAAEVLITDYSNTLFEFAYTGRDVFLYAPDVDEYASNRGFYFDYNKLPYPKAVTEQELCNNIVKYNSKYYREEQKKFFDSLGIKEDGKASDRIAAVIIKKLG